MIVYRLVAMLGDSQAHVLWITRKAGDSVQKLSDTLSDTFIVKYSTLVWEFMCLFRLS